jgi:hypothetical protein
MASVHKRPMLHMDRARGHGLLCLTYHIYTMGQFPKLTEGFDHTNNSWVDCGLSNNISNDVTTGIPQTAKSSDVTDLSDIIFPARKQFLVGYATLTVGPM